MKTIMTLQELREYIRSMPDDEILQVTIEQQDKKREDGGRQHEDREI